MKPVNPPDFPSSKLLNDFFEQAADSRGRELWVALLQAFQHDRRCAAFELGGERREVRFGSGDLVVLVAADEALVGVEGDRRFGKRKAGFLAQPLERGAGSVDGETLRH